MKNPLPSIQKFVEKHFILILLTIFVIAVVLVLFNKPKQPPPPAPPPKPTPPPPPPAPPPPLKFTIENGIVNMLGRDKGRPVVMSIQDSSGQPTQWKYVFDKPDGVQYNATLLPGGSFNITYTISSGDAATKSYGYETMADVVKNSVGGRVVITDYNDNIYFNLKKAPY
jgi:hypothetical protein